MSMYEMYPEWGPPWRDGDTGDRVDDGSVGVSQGTDQPAHADTNDED